jgi:transposase
VTKAEGEKLLRDNAELRALVASLTEQIAKLTERVAELLAVAQRRQRKPAPEKPPEPRPEVGGEAKHAFERRPKPPKKTARPEPKKRKVAPTGRKPLPQHLEAEEHALRPDACGECGSAALDVADELLEEKLHVVKEHQRRRVVRRTTCRCRDCGARTTPRSLPAPYERSKVTSAWLAWFVHNKFALLSPLDRIRRDLADRGVPLAMGSLVGFVERAADQLAPIDGLHWKQLLAGSWMATDGTGLKVLVPNLPAAHDGYIELYRNRECAVFQYAADKGSDDVVAKLRTFRGKLTADAEHRFNAVYASGDIIEAGCNAHYLEPAVIRRRVRGGAISAGRRRASLDGAPDNDVRRETWRRRSRRCHLRSTGHASSRSGRRAAGRRARSPCTRIGRAASQRTVELVIAIQSSTSRLNRYVVSPRSIRRVAAAPRSSARTLSRSGLCRAPSPLWDVPFRSGPRDRQPDGGRH